MNFLRQSLRQSAQRWPLALVRALSGHMWTGTALVWIRTEDRALNLVNHVGRLVETGRPTDWYQPFLEGVVLPNASVFAALVTTGEAFVAVSLLLGVATRAGAAVAMMLLCNYSLLYGQSFLVPAGNTLDFWVSFLFLITASGRAFGVDYWLHRRWPRVPLW